LAITPLMIRERHATYGSKSQANHAMRVLSAVFNHYIDLNELDKANPVQKALSGKGKASRWHKQKRRKTFVKPGQMTAWFVQTTDQILFICGATSVQHCWPNRAF
jgi:hypothetical protein